jgi:transcriptional antiterminator Rof (Rho-off)
MSINDSLEKAKTYIQEAFAECYDYTEVACLFHSIVQEAKNQVRFMCQRIAEEEKEGRNDRT